MTCKTANKPLPLPPRSPECPAPAHWPASSSASTSAAPRPAESGSKTGSPAADESVGSSNVQNVSRDEAARNIAELFARIGEGPVSRVYAGSGGIDTAEDAEALAALITAARSRRRGHGGARLPPAAGSRTAPVPAWRSSPAPARQRGGRTPTAPRPGPEGGVTCSATKAADTGWAARRSATASAGWTRDWLSMHSRQRCWSHAEWTTPTGSLPCSTHRTPAAGSGPSRHGTWWRQPPVGTRKAGTLLDQAGKDLAGLALQVLRQLGINGPGHPRQRPGHERGPPPGGVPAPPR